jgi:hypothetical protein
VEVDRGLGELGGGGDEPGLDLARAAPLAHDEVAQEAAVRAAVEMTQEKLIDRGTEFGLRLDRSGEGGAAPA